MLMMLICWAEAYILLKRNFDALVVGNKETRLEVNVDKTEYTVMF